jgi:CheY-like chemotaxis protein
MESNTEILVVEDDKGVRDMLIHALPQYGFFVRSAASGQEAIEVFQRHHDTIKIVLMDVQMAELDGPQTLAALKAIDPDVRCCFMSGHTGKYTNEDLLEMGVTCVLAKPFGSLHELVKILRESV